mmetsp:Transcript_24416/g.96886  ORF Transcript_24416/g.96886 Transcript_24416/m.96886 type:complete len:392 (-) Transcript_24416:981-2156(-)
MRVSLRCASVVVVSSDDDDDDDDNKAAGKSSSSKSTVKDRPVRKAAGILRFGTGCRPTCALFSRGAHHNSLVTGSTDGFVEIWDWTTCRLRTDLEYQAKDELLVHDAAISAVSESPDATMLASADIRGGVKLWVVNAGLRKHQWALESPATAIAYGAKSIAVGLSDGAVRTLGPKSGAVTATCRGHDGFVSALCFVGESLVASAAADATVRVWRVDGVSGSSSQCVRCLPLSSSNERPVVALAPLIDDADADLLAVQDDGRAWRCREADAQELLLEGDDDVGTTTKSDDTKSGAAKNAKRTTPANRRRHVSAAAVSHSRRWLYGVAGAKLDVYDLGGAASSTAVMRRSRLDLRESASSKDETTTATGLAVHPFRSLVATFGDDDVLRLWKA